MILDTSRVKDGMTGATGDFHLTGVIDGIPLMTGVIGGFHLTRAGKANRRVSGIRENMDMTALATLTGSRRLLFPGGMTMNLLLRDNTEEDRKNHNPFLKEMGRKIHSAPF